MAEMDKKSLFVIQNALWHACDTIKYLACENYSNTDFQDKDLEKMFLELIDMAISLCKKLNEEAAS